MTNTEPGVRETLVQITIDSLESLSYRLLSVDDITLDLFDNLGKRSNSRREALINHLFVMSLQIDFIHQFELKQLELELLKTLLKLFNVVLQASLLFAFKDVVELSEE